MSRFRTSPIPRQGVSSPGFEEKRQGFDPERGDDCDDDTGNEDPGAYREEGLLPIQSEDPCSQRTGIGAGNRQGQCDEQHHADISVAVDFRLHLGLGVGEQPIDRAVVPAYPDEEPVQGGKKEKDRRSDEHVQERREQECGGDGYGVCKGVGYCPPEL